MARPIQSSGSGEMAQMIAMMMEFDSRREEREQDREERREARSFQDRQMQMQLDDKKEAMFYNELNDIRNNPYLTDKQKRAMEGALRERYGKTALPPKGADPKKEPGLWDKIKDRGDDLVRNVGKSFKVGGTVGVAHDIVAKSAGGIAGALGGGKEGAILVHDAIKNPIDTAKDVAVGLGLQDDSTYTEGGYADIPPEDLGFAKQREDALELGISLDELRALRRRVAGSDVDIPEREPIPPFRL